MTPSRRHGPILALAVLLLTACAAGPDTVEPTGVDGLEIPTPTPDPGDFVEVVDNPWLPLRPGSEWVYEAPGDVSRTITVTGETREVADVATTVVEDVVTGADGEVIQRSSRWYAQDRAGNVWWFGLAGSWEAGVDGARAGLAMPATPRLGDGYTEAYAAGVVEDRATVLALDETQDVAAGSFDDLLVTENTTPLEPALVQRLSYARGTGLVRLETISGGSGELELVSFTPGGAEG